jgi:hypothetical protein
VTRPATALKPAERSVDHWMMAGLMALFSALLGACGLGLFGLGIGMSIENELAGGLISVAVGLLTLYGCYLFGRAAWRTQSAEKSGRLTTSDLRARRSKLKNGVAYGLISLVGVVFVPGPGTFKVILVVAVGLGVVVGLSAQVEPKKSRH